jgi:preprotein translocase subunit SecG
MTIVFSILIILACVVLILAVLVQNPKGGGLATGFQGGSQVMGVRRTADFLEKATWTLAVLLFVFSIGAGAYTKKGAVADGQTSATKDMADQFENNNKPAAPAANPFGGPGNGMKPAPAPSPAKPN